jgi:hypothetical protein
MIQDLEKLINNLHNTPSDINEHIPTLIKYGSECEHITEMGVRWVVSTWAFLGTVPKTLKSYDMQDPSTWNVDIKNVYDTAKYHGVNFSFTKANVLDIEIEETDLLFLDTWHAYKQLKSELDLHAGKVRKYIIFHDTTTFATQDESSYEFLGKEWVGDGKGIWLAIEEFLSVKPEWKLVERFTNNNGLTIIGKTKNI